MKQYKVLFLCPHNSARSILGVALSATPGTVVNPFAAEFTVKMGYDQKLLCSKSWDEYAYPEAPKMDLMNLQEIHTT